MAWILTILVLLVKKRYVASLENQGEYGKISLKTNKLEKFFKLAITWIAMLKYAQKMGEELLNYLNLILF